jgi:hypothetical protein
MKRSVSWRMLVALALVIAPVAASFMLSPDVSRAQSAAPAPAAADDEIIVLESTGAIRIYDPLTPAGYTPATWTSPDTGWYAIAAGDFNKDGDDEIVAIKGNTLKVYDPFGPAGSVPASFTNTIGGLSYRLLATGDFDKDGYDEIAATHTSSQGFSEELTVYDGNANGTSWAESHNEGFGASWRAMSAGDMNNDGYADLALVREENNGDGRTKVYDGNLWGTLAERVDSFPWLSVQLGNISNSYTGDEIALTRSGVGADFASLIIWRLSGSALVDLDQALYANYKWLPYFTSLSLGDLNGDSDREIVLLRDPEVNKTALNVVNPVGALMPEDLESNLNYPTVWQQVRSGDVDADGRAEIVVLRSAAFREYTDPELNQNYQDTAGSYRVPLATDYDRSTMVLANVDGLGYVPGPMLLLNPASLSFDQTSLHKTVAVSNSTTSDVLAWTAQVTSGGAWLSVDPPASGSTPGSLNVSVDLSTITPNVTYSGAIRVTAPAALNSPQTLNVSLLVTDTGLLVSPKQLVIRQRIGGPLVTKTVSIVRLGVPTAWVATAVSTAEAERIIDALADGSATVGSEGLIVDGAPAAAPAWLSFTPESGTTPTNMTVSVIGTAPGVYTAAILIVTKDPSVPNGVQRVDVTATVQKGNFLPSVLK